MLEIKKKITLTGESLMDGKQAEGYQATIDSENPDDMVLSSWQTDKAL